MKLQENNIKKLLAQICVLSDQMPKKRLPEAQEAFLNISETVRNNLFIKKYITSGSSFLQV